MDCYRIEIKPRAIKQLRKLPSAVLAKVSKQIDNLSENPRPDGCKKLSGTEHSYRVRVGDYRVVYSVFDKRLIIQVIKIGHRKDIYK
ncbi:MAG: type II toxin-antitoxin system RelE family toxin [Gammaproteobacteria bacterium]